MIKNSLVRKLLPTLVAGAALSARLCRAEDICLRVDATRTSEKLLHVSEVINVTPGPLTLFYPKWIPGQHRPAGPIASLVGLRFEALGDVLTWKRDALDVFTFHVEIPPRATTLKVEFDFIEGGGATDKLLALDWNAAVLYPSGSPVSRLTVVPTITVPHAWKVATALGVNSERDDTLSFEPVTLEQLVDSPLIAGQYFRAVDLTPTGDSVHHELDIVADSQAALQVPETSRRQMKNLVSESVNLFGGPHYRQYRFLLALTDQASASGLEHHESSINRLPEGLFLSSDPGKDLGGLLAHEFVHSWNGKFRRPSDLTMSDFEQPMRTDLLWVYEGLTDYLGLVLATRSGLWTEEEYRRYLATTAAALGQGRPGRTWRPLLDATVSVPGPSGLRGWDGWRRDGDFYGEGALIWLEADTIIHQQSHGKKSLDDFCRLFYGGANRGPEVRTYSFSSLVTALNETARYDWMSFLQKRLNSTSSRAPIGGIEAAGWQLAFESTSAIAAVHDDQADIYSLGVMLGADGTVLDSLNDGPAFKAGVVSGMKVIGVNGRLYTHELLEEAIMSSKADTSQPITLTIINSSYIETPALDYHMGIRSPVLRPKPETADYLNEILSSRAERQRQ